MDSPRPQPILKTVPDQRGGPSIRFAGSTQHATRSHSAPANVQVNSHSHMPTRQQVQIQTQPLRSPQHMASGSSGYRDQSSPAQIQTRPQAIFTSPPPVPSNPAIQRLQGPRRSSRPTSPASTSFGARLPQVPGDPLPLTQAAQLSTPPTIASEHVTTPPTAYASTLHCRAPPPPSPYRPTSERRITPICEMRGVEHLASRPPRVSSLFDTPCAPTRAGFGMGEQTPRNGYTGDDEDGLPTFNFIPATPQAMGEDWGMRRSASGSALERPFPMDDMVEIPLEPSFSAPVIGIGMSNQAAFDGLPTLDSLPAIANLEFSPFDVSVPLPSVDSGNSISSLPYSIDSRDQASVAEVSLTTFSQQPPTQPLPSPPFQSYSSLPSLDSEPSLHHSTSQCSLPSSSSNSSLASYTDVEEALGSMLASLSNPAMPNVPSVPRLDRIEKSSSNPGLGLGLALPAPASITAPLAPRRKGPPPALDLSQTSKAAAAGPDQYSAPARINHRVAFYTTARAAPNSAPTSGIFTSASAGHNGQTEFIIPSPTRSESDSSIFSSDTQLTSVKDVNGWRDSIRSSISIGSEASDDDPYTASIVCLTPVKGGVAAVYRDEVLMDGTAVVGLAL